MAKARGPTLVHPGLSADVYSGKAVMMMVRSWTTPGCTRWRFGSLAAGRRLFIWSKKMPENFGSISLSNDCETLRFRFGFRFLVFLGRLERKVWLVRMIDPRARQHGEHMRMIRLIIAQILVWPAQCTTTPRTASRYQVLGDVAISIPVCVCVWGGLVGTRNK